MRAVGGIRYACAGETNGGSGSFAAEIYCHAFAAKRHAATALAQVQPDAGGDSDGFADS